ncbi:MAG: FAD-dependent oxidoreductase, partial [Thermoleophilia bacterium]|nr:FAD-dependent oxidoreductase [Thermoleophilia bacterium]
KAALVDDWDEERVALTSAGKLADLRLDLRLGLKATGLDVVSRELSLADGSLLKYDGLVIATGARARRLPGTEDLTGVLTLRTLNDARALRRRLAARPSRVVICGAGFIGAEVASSARSLGLDVTVLEMATVPFARILGDEMGRVCAGLQLEHGVDLRTDVGVQGVEGRTHVAAVTLTTGETLETDLLVVAIGAVPNTEWLEGSGLAINDGVLCDETCQAAPGVVVAGDVARWPNPTSDGELMRVEHWDNAATQAAHAVRTLLAGDGSGEAYGPVPWFWSDQFGRTIQLAGRPRPGDEVAVVAGSVEQREFAAIYGREGRLVGVLGFNKPREVMAHRRMIAERATWHDVARSTAEPDSRATSLRPVGPHGGGQWS